MAYIFLTPNSQSVFKIAANDSEKQKIVGHVNQNALVQQTISDTEFENLRANTHFIKIENGAVTVTELEDGWSFTSAEDLNAYINELKVTINRYLKNFSENANYSQWSSYYDQLNNFNTGSLTYPFEKSLEKHFQESSLPYFNILELP
jgi:hypothetical protein